MSQSIQPITEALSRGDKPGAIELIKQALAVDPGDVDVLLLLATLAEEPTRKRQVLNRILSVMPTHKAARDMLLELDRAEMSAYHARPAPASVSPATSHTVNNPEVAAPLSQQPLQPAEDSPSASPSRPLPEKPLVFRPSTVWLVVLYLFTGFFCCAGDLVAGQNIGNSLPSFGLGCCLV